MGKFKKPVKKPVTNAVDPKLTEFIDAADTNTPMKSPATKDKTMVTLKIDVSTHQWLKKIAELEDRSMQWILRNLTTKALETKAKELGII